MKKILMLLAFVVVSAMCESDYKTEKNFSQKERFEMLFGNTTLQFIEVRQARTCRSTRHNRKLEARSVLSVKKMIDPKALTQDEKYEMLFGKTILTKRIARTSRLIFARQARRSLYVGLNF